MSFLCYSDLYFFLPTIISFGFVWVVFFYNNSVLISISAFDTSISLNLLKSRSVSIFLNIYKYVLFFLVFYLFLLFGQNSAVCYNNLLLNNVNIKIIFIFFFFGVFLISQIDEFTISRLNLSYDYLFILTNLSITLPYLFCTNTIFFFIFFLEFLSCLLFYKLISSRVWYNNYYSSKIDFKKKLPINFINMIFFQYWVSFFSTIFLVYAYVSLISFFGTSEWVVFNVFLSRQHAQLASIDIAYLIVAFLLLLAFFLKLGLAPFHMFKLEVYNGLPFFSVFFYTLYYFLIFLFYFIYFLLNLTFGFLYFYYFILFIIVFVGTIFTISLLFDVTYLKSFLLYSSLLNSIGFLILFISNM